MKTNTFPFLVLLTIMMALVDCQRKEINNLQSITIDYEGHSFPVNTQKQRLIFIEEVSGKTASDIEIVVIEQLQDSLGKYKAMKAQYQEEGKEVTLVIPLEPVDVTKTRFRTACVMSCSADLACGPGIFEITKRCGALSCSCANELGGGSTSVRF